VVEEEDTQDEVVEEEDAQDEEVEENTEENIVEDVQENQRENSEEQNVQDQHVISRQLPTIKNEVRRQNVRENLSDNETNELLAFYRENNSKQNELSLKITNDGKKVVEALRGEEDTEEAKKLVQGLIENYKKSDKEGVLNSKYMIAFSKEEENKLAKENPNTQIITPSTVNKYGVSIMYSAMYGLNPFEDNSKDLFVQKISGERMAFDSNLAKQKDLPTIFSNNSKSNNISIRLETDEKTGDFKYEGVVVKVTEPEEKDKDQEVKLKEIERNKGQFEGYKDIYKVKTHLQDGKYYFFVNKLDKDGERIKGMEAMYVVEFEVTSNRMLEAKPLELQESELKGEDGDKKMLTIKGKVDKAGVVINVSWESVILSSVVISDANGEFEVSVPEKLAYGQHEVIAYASETQVGSMRSVFSNLVGLSFFKNL